LGLSVTFGVRSGIKKYGSDTKLIIEQLKELKTDMCAIDRGQEALKSDITTTKAELKTYLRK
jgi:hypothetical protein